MKAEKKNLNVWLILAGILFILLILIFGYRFLALRVRANIVRPQILIHTPFNQEEINTAEGRFVHATARSEVGIRRVEIWIDGTFFTAQEMPAGEAISPLVIHEFWQPEGAGLHKVVVRAFDINDTEGIASVLITANSNEVISAAPFDPTGLVAAGEIPAENPEPASAEEPAPVSSGDSGGGDGGGGGGGAASSPPADERPAAPAPAPADEEEGPALFLESIQFLFLEVFDFFGDEPEDENIPSPDEDHMLKLEALALETDASYEGVHCYVGLGDRTPSWYPDADHDPATDEHFAAIGEGQWNIADYLADDNGVAISWPGDNALTLNINCVGYTDGGTRAVNLGLAEINIPPTDWDGVTRQASASDEGTFTLSYRVGLEEPTPFELNPDMPAPYNLQIDDRRQELSWEWSPNPDVPLESPNYLVYVNDILVFQTSYRTRSVRLPYIWFNPPCGTNYEFRVVAYLPPYPEGDYSLPSEPLYLPALEDEPRTDCSPEFIVSFDWLMTGDLGGDSDIRNNWGGMVEPVSGSFFANDVALQFSNVTLLPNQTYNMSELTGGPTFFTYEVQEGEVLSLSFEMVDFDDGRSEPLCSFNVYHDFSYNMLMDYGYFEGNISSIENDGMRCIVHYTIRPLSGTPFGSSSESLIPLPWIDVTGLRLSPEGNIEFDIKNTGSAELANQNVRFDIMYQDSEDMRGYYREEIYLDIGQQTTITTTTAVNNIGNFCIIVDPENQIAELYEATLAIQHTTFRYCLPRPDLVINEVQFNADTNTLLINVRNQGESSSNIISTGNTINAQDILIEVDPVDPSGVTFITPLRQFPDVVMTHHDSIVLEWPLSADLRGMLSQGYTLTIDPLNNFAETDEDNNTFRVGSGKNLRVSWDGIQARWYPNIFQECNNWGRWAVNSSEIWVDVYARTESSSRHIGTWNWDDSIGDNYNIGEFTSYRSWDTTNYQMEFFINAEENLVIETHGDQSTLSMGSGSATFYNWNDWNIMDSIRNTNPDCDPSPGLGHVVMAYPPRDRWSVCGGWGVFINVCEVYGD